jgi:hypothetical protein
MSVSTIPFDERASRALARLIAERGVELAAMPERLGSFLRDECGEAKREINVLLDAAREHVVDDLRVADAAPLAARQATLAQRLQDHRGTHPDLARWAVSAWSRALGLDAGDDWDSPAPSPSPPPSPAPSPVPVPRPSWLDALANAWRSLGASARWGLAAAAAAALGWFGWEASVGATGRLVQVEVAGTAYTSARPGALAEVIGDGRGYKRVYQFRTPDGAPAKSIELRWTDGTVFGDGKDRKIIPLTLSDAQRGRYEESFEYFGVLAERRGEAVLVYGDDRRSAPIAFGYRAVPVPGTAAPRILGVQYPSEFPADGQFRTFRIEYEDGDADLQRIELKVIEGDWKSSVQPIQNGLGQKRGTIEHQFSSKSPQRAVINLRLIDAKGNYSDFYTVRFATVAATGAPAPAAGFTITKIDPPAPVPAGGAAKAQVKIYYAGGDVVRAEWFRRGESAAGGASTWDPAPPGKTYTSVTMTLAAPAAAGSYPYEVVVIDPQGRRSARQPFTIVVNR